MAAGKELVNFIFMLPVSLCYQVVTALFVLQDNNTQQFPCFITIIIIIFVIAENRNHRTIKKKHKIAMKKLQFAIVIALGSNCSGVIIWGVIQYS